ncbi:toll/interleukin-1 receptor domain-containing protein [Treponema parvum]|uniref:Toll/interleukin-1 receptor domain-containing protein n=1 Tax=Treponema parvum TaxID=138851 RepID=A0A975F230_9SPIR|nr:toll/interleukin-1 receptor domain-containing protein [Treponema parvum]QTQ12684.1 toll/interleukin-1 receptor domain-containing protein [Treponema parvum]QTQ15340.1 toll/interleukin-1 receptor domain-containing protein [Treponema parvum]
MENHPKVFISYSWTVQKEVVKLAQRLVNDGIDTIVDFWNLKPGNDKYKFMESMVTDKTIDFVLIVCDKTYTEKANDRTGGVGDETVIISSELYGKFKQEKFLPLILGKNEDSSPTVPVYIKTRIYFDFSDENNYENEYEKLIRHIYDEPLISKPKLGSKPEYLKNNSVDIVSLRSGISILKTENTDLKKNAVLSDFPKNFTAKVKEFKIDTANSDKDFIASEIVSKIDAMKPLRDIYLDFLKEVISSERDVASFIYNFFETTYNELMLVDKNVHSRFKYYFYHYTIFIWELFVCTIAYLRHYEKYSLLHDILTHTYYLQRELSPASNIKPCSFVKFRCYPTIVDDTYRYKEEDLVSKTANIMVSRVKEPIITKKSFAETDIFLTQMSFALNQTYHEKHWFALSYIYADNPENIWVRLSSKEYCEKILPLFGVSSIDELKKVIATNPVTPNYCYPNDLDSIPPIPLQIGNDQIASLK